MTKSHPVDDDGPRPPVRLGFRTWLAVRAGRAAAWASRRAGRGRGQVIGGQVMLRFDPGVVAALARGKAVTLVSATNGKSTTTRFVAEALAGLGAVAHNSTGANMAPGVASALAEARAAPYAALEVDEAHLPALLEATGAGVVVLMNLSRDQLDRGAEVRRLAVRWREMLGRSARPPIVVGNADDPLVAWACMAAPDVRWVAAGQRWRDDAALCPACAQTLDRGTEAWYCPGCHLARPEPDWRVARDAIVPPGGPPVVARLRLPGRVNVANAAMAAAAVDVWGVAPAQAVAAFERVGDVDGRYVEAVSSGRPVRLLLGKNPASWAELIDMAQASAHRLVVAINARGADGRDPSWLWDVPFEALAGRPVWATGERRFDLAVRLDTAGLAVAGVAADPLAAVAELDGEEVVDVVANYTAFQSLRARLTP